MLEQAVHHLVGLFADRFAGYVDGSIASQDEMRAKRADYKDKVRHAAVGVLTTFADNLTEAMRERFEEWLHHPRLGHASLVEEGRITDNELQQSIAEYQRTGSPAALTNATLAIIRSIAITRVVGAECIYAAATPRKPKKPRKKTDDRRMSRRKIALADIPGNLIGAVARLGANDPQREEALVTLREASYADSSGIAAKLFALAASPAQAEFISQLASEAAAQMGHAEGSADIPSADAEADTAKASAPSIVADECVEAPANNSDRNEEMMRSTPSRDVAGEQLDDGGEQAEVIYNFVSEHGWALVSAGSAITLKPLKKRSVNRAFDLVGHLPAVQTRLRAMLSEYQNRGRTSS